MGTKWQQKGLLGPFLVAEREVYTEVKVGSVKKKEEEMSDFLCSIPPQNAEFLSFLK